MTFSTDGMNLLTITYTLSYEERASYTSVTAKASESDYFIFDIDLLTSSDVSSALSSWRVKTYTKQESSSDTSEKSPSTNADDPFKGTSWSVTNNGFNYQIVFYDDGTSELKQYSISTVPRESYSVYKSSDGIYTADCGISSYTLKISSASATSGTFSWHGTTLVMTKDGAESQTEARWLLNITQLPTSIIAIMVPTTRLQCPQKM